MPAQWKIDAWPRCVADVFLSHCAEDRDHLIRPVFDELTRRSIAAWADWNHYPLGRDSFEGLRENLLRCRHVVYFITPAMLVQSRGWANTERAFGATIQQRLRYGDIEIAHVELPLVFVSADHPVLRRSAWRGLLEKIVRCPHSSRRSVARTLRVDDGQRLWTTEHVAWACDVICRFIAQEREWAVELGSRFAIDSALRNSFSQEENLKRRVLALAP